MYHPLVMTSGNIQDNPLKQAAASISATPLNNVLPIVNVHISDVKPFFLGIFFKILR